MPRPTFLTVYWGTVAATDFFIVDVATVRRLVTSRRTGPHLDQNVLRPATAR